MKNDLNGLIYDINTYLDYVREKYGYSMSIHFSSNAPSAIQHKFIKYYSHNNPYCLIIRTNLKVHKICGECQKKIRESGFEKPFFGMCHAGVEEFVFPIVIDKTNAFISVSGYRKNIEKALERIKIISKNTEIDEVSLIDAYINNLSTEIPSFEEMKIVLNPVRYMIEKLLDEASKSNCNISDTYKNNVEYLDYLILSYVQKNFMKKISVEDISKHCNYSVSYISHLFCDIHKCGISKYILKYRINKSKELLEYTTFTIQQISTMVGFSDSNYYTATFKKHCSISPTAYREKVRTYN